MLFRGYSSAGRALEWHSRGQRFDPAYLHHSMFYGLYSTEYKPFYFPKNKYRDDAGSFHRHSSILPLLKKAVSTFIQKIVRAAFFCCPEMCLTVRHFFVSLVDGIYSCRTVTHRALLTRVLH